MRQPTLPCFACIAVLVATLFLPRGTPLAAAGSDHPTTAPYPAVPAGTVPIRLAQGLAEPEPGVQEAILAVLNRERASLPAMQYAAVTGVEEAQGYALVSMAGLRQVQPDGSWSLLEDGSWFGLVAVARQADGIWLGAVEHSADYASLIAAAPATLLSQAARSNLAPARAPGAIEGQPFRFPWEPGTSMGFGARGVHNSDFGSYFGINGWKAVDFVSDGDVAQGHAPNRLLASAPGTVGPVCNDGTAVAIRMDYGGQPQLIYVHILNNSRLHTGYTFEAGDEIGLMKTGPFKAACGWAEQGDNWFHVHWGFPGDSGYFQAEGWTLDLISQVWQRDGQVVGMGGWMRAGLPSVPVLVSPPADTVEPVGYNLEFSWEPSPGATAYQLEWQGGPYTNTQPLGWFAATSYEVGQVAPGTYWWRVRARNAAGLTPWSDSRQITITPVELTGSLAITPTIALPGQPITAEFSLRNATTVTLEMPLVAVRVLSPGCADWSCAEWTDFPAAADVRLLPGEAFVYHGERSFPAAGGRYLAVPIYQDVAGVWHRAIPGANAVSFTVGNKLLPRIYLPALESSGVQS